MKIQNMIALVAMGVIASIPCIDAHGWIQKPLARQLAIGKPVLLYIRDSQSRKISKYRDT